MTKSTSLLVLFLVVIGVTITSFLLAVDAVGPGCGGGTENCAPGERCVNNNCECCPSGRYGTTGINCQCCPQSKYSSSDCSTSCQSCPAGTESPSCSTSASSCTSTSCNAGSYKCGSLCCFCSGGYYTSSANTQTSCNQCPAGKFSGSGATSCTTCACGSSSAAGSSSCESCIAGEKAKAGETCSKCKAGQRSSSGSCSCHNCGLGFYSPSAGSSSCTKCASGSFCNQQTCSSCDPCPCGRVSSSQSSSCSACAAGSTTTGDSGRSSCDVTPKGTFSGSGQCNPTKCPRGTFNPNLGSVNSNACVKCAPGTSSNALGASSITTCQNCSIGYFCASPGGCASCQQASKGHFVNVTHSAVQYACPAGTQNNQFAQKNISACLPCELGYSSNAGAALCDPAPAGSFVNETRASSLMIHACPAGTSTRGKNARTSLSDCLPCRLGETTNLLSAQAWCLACDAGSFGNVSRSSANKSVCSGLCDAGTFSTTNSSSCEKCGLGSSSNVSGTKDACPSVPCGHYADELGLVNAKLCPGGSYNPSTGSTSKSSCINATAGYAAPEGSCSQTPCPLAQVSNASAAACTCCGLDDSNSSSSSSSSSSIISLWGTFMNRTGSPWIEFSGCYPCPAGTFAPPPNNTLPVSERQCASGCESCPHHTFSNLERQGKCRNCPSGYESFHLKQTSNSTCSPCQIKYWSKSGEACQLCPAAHFCNLSRLEFPYTEPVDTLAQFPKYPFPCPAGTASPELGLINGNASFCIPCNLSYFCPEASLYETPCPKGHFCDKVRLGAAIRCPMHTWNNVTRCNSSSCCRACPHNQFTRQDAAEGIEWCSTRTMSLSQETKSQTMSSGEHNNPGGGGGGNTISLSESDPTLSNSEATSSPSISNSTSLSLPSVSESAETLTHEETSTPSHHATETHTETETHEETSTLSVPATETHTETETHEPTSTETIPATSSLTSTFSDSRFTHTLTPDDSISHDQSVSRTHPSASSSATSDLTATESLSDSAPTQTLEKLVFAQSLLSKEVTAVVGASVALSSALGSPAIVQAMSILSIGGSLCRLDGEPGVPQELEFPQSILPFWKLDAPSEDEQKEMSGAVETHRNIAIEYLVLPQHRGAAVVNGFIFAPAVGFVTFICFIIVTCVKKKKKKNTHKKENGAGGVITESFEEGAIVGRFFQSLGFAVEGAVASSVFLLAESGLKQKGSAGNTENSSSDFVLAVACLIFTAILFLISFSMMVYANVFKKSAVFVEADVLVTIKSKNKKDKSKKKQTSSMSNNNNDNHNSLSSVMMLNQQQNNTEENDWSASSEIPLISSSSSSSSPNATSAATAAAGGEGISVLVENLNDEKQQQQQQGEQEEGEQNNNSNRKRKKEPLTWYWRILLGSGVWMTGPDSKLESLRKQLLPIMKNVGHVQDINHLLRRQKDQSEQAEEEEKDNYSSSSSSSADSALKRFFATTACFLYSADLTVTIVLAAIRGAALSEPCQVKKWALIATIATGFMVLFLLSVRPISSPIRGTCQTLSCISLFLAALFIFLDFERKIIALVALVGVFVGTFGSVVGRGGSFLFKWILKRKLSPAAVSIEALEALEKISGQQQRGDGGDSAAELLLFDDSDDAAGINLFSSQFATVHKEQEAEKLEQKRIREQLEKEQKQKKVQEQRERKRKQEEKLLEIQREREQQLLFEQEMMDFPKQEQGGGGGADNDNFDGDFDFYDNDGGDDDDAATQIAGNEEEGEVHDKIDIIAELTVAAAAAAAAVEDEMNQQKKNNNRSKKEQTQEYEGEEEEESQKEQEEEEKIEGWDDFLLDDNNATSSLNNNNNNQEETEGEENQEKVEEDPRMKRFRSILDSDEDGDDQDGSNNKKKNERDSDDDSLFDALEKQGEEEERLKREEEENLKGIKRKKDGGDDDEASRSAEYVSELERQKRLRRLLDQLDDEDEMYSGEEEKKRRKQKEQQQEREEKNKKQKQPSNSDEAAAIRAKLARFLKSNDI